MNFKNPICIICFEKHSTTTGETDGGNEVGEREIDYTYAKNKENQQVEKPSTPKKAYPQQDPINKLFASIRRTNEKNKSKANVSNKVENELVEETPTKESIIPISKMDKLTDKFINSGNSQGKPLRKEGRF